MNYETKRLLERKGLLGLSVTEQVEGLMNAISTLGLFKFAVGVHTLYVSAIRDLSPGDEQRAKDACNERAIKPVY